jgi:hypothetical protein
MSGMTATSETAGTTRTAGATSGGRPASPGERWRNLPRRWQVVFVVAAAAVALQIAGSMLSGIYSPPTTSTSGPGSSLDTSTAGTAAFSDLLTQRHYSVQQLSVPLQHAASEGDGTLFVLDPSNAPTVLAAASNALAAFVNQGGRLVMAGRVAPPVLSRLLGGGAIPAWDAAPSGNGRPAAAVPEDTGVNSVLGGTGHWVLPSSTSGAASPAEALLTAETGDLALVASVGKGTLVLLASSNALSDGALAKADDAAFGLDLAGPTGAVVGFDEYDHGYGHAGTGLAGLPGHWKAGLLVGLGAALVWMLSAARRFGPPQRMRRDLIPPRVAHVDAMALLLSSGSTDRIAAGAEPLKRRARDELETLLRAGQDATDRQLAELAARGDEASVPPRLVETLLKPPRTDADLVALGKAFSELQGRRRP